MLFIVRSLQTTLSLVALSSIRCSAKNFAAFSQQNSRHGEIIRIQKRVQAWNVDGSSSDRPKSSSHIKDWEIATGSLRGICSFEDCNCNDTSSLVGGHVMVPGIGVCIVPICRRCNYYRNSKRFQDTNGNNSYVRAFSELMKTNLTTDMKNAPRRFK
jgi:hypothetical protein